MGKDIEKLARECESCQENARSKPNIPGKRNEVKPTSLETGAAGELLSTDFGQYGRSNLLTVRDRYSGLLRVFLSPDKTMKAASKGIERWMHCYGIPRELRSDAGRCMGRSSQSSVGRVE